MNHTIHTLNEYKHEQQLTVCSKVSNKEDFQTFHEQGRRSKSKKAGMIGNSFVSRIGKNRLTKKNLNEEVCVRTIRRSKMKCFIL